MNGLKIVLKITSIIFYGIIESDQSIIIANNYYDGEDIDPSNGLEKVIEHCANRDSEYKQLSIVSADREPGVNFYEYLHEGSKIAVEIFGGLEGLNSVDWRSCVVLWLSEKEIAELFDTSERFSPKPSNLLLIHSADKSGRISREDILDAGRSLWRKNYVHKLIVSVNGSRLLFDPFAPTATPSERNSFGALRNIAESMGPIDRRDDFTGYEIGVAMFPYLTARKIDGEYKGCAGNAMREIIERMNVTFQIHEVPEMFGWVAKDGKATGTLGRIVYHRSDLTFNEFFVKNYGVDNLDFSTYLATDQICMILPKRGKIPPYLLILRIFSPFNWAIIFVGNSFIALIYLWIKRVVSFSQSDSRRDNNLAKNAGGYRGKFAGVQRFVFTWIFICFYPLKTRINWFGERLHVAFGLIFGIVIGGCFTGKLASSFSKPVNLKNIETLEELDQSGFQILTVYPNLLKDVFVDSNSATLKNLHNKLQLKNDAEVKRHVFVDKDGALLEREHIVIVKENVSTPVELHLVPDCPRKYFLAYPIVKGSPFKRRLDTLIGRLHFSGMYLKWFKDMMKGPEPPKSRKPVVIKLQHLLIPFFILFLGLGMATVVFCLEKGEVEGVEPL